MTDVQIAVRLRGKAGLESSVKAAVAQIFGDRFANEIARRRRSVRIAHRISLESRGFADNTWSCATSPSSV